MDDNTEGVVALIFMLFIPFGVPSCIMLGLAIPALIAGKNTGAVGILSHVAVETYGVCRGDVHFTTGNRQEISSQVEIPCESLSNSTEISIDLCYNRRNPNIVGFDNKLAARSNCSETGYDEACRMVLASVILLSVFLFIVGAVLWNLLRFKRQQDTMELASLKKDNV